MPTLTVDGREITVEPGCNLIEAARRLGIEVPHYCYHPALTVVGQCRLCMVELEGQGKLQIGCYTRAADGMVVHTRTPKVLETRQAIMEFHLINHPLDCPVCDQSGECWLQIYYMQHGLYEPRMVEDKVRKPKAVPLGPHVILDAERCILCSRCTRFCDEVTGTGELGIFNRGDHSEIGLFPGKVLDNPYSGNVVDICPVGALTDRDFRFRVRVWYLDRTRSVCPGCSRGCNIEIHTNTRRPHQSKGARVARLKPRFNAEVNRWWLCDEGRYGHGFIDAPDRLLDPALREDGYRPRRWEEVLPVLAERLRGYRPEECGVLLSPQLANEELYLARRLFAETLGWPHLDFRVPPRAPGYEDDFLIKADKNPNSRGAELIGLGPRVGGLDLAGMLEAARAGRLRCLWVFGHDLLASGLPEAEVRGALERLDWLIFQGTNANGTSRLAHLVLPGATYAEKEGTFTNFEGRVQRFWRAVSPLGQSLPDGEILVRVAHALGHDWRPRGSEELFRELAGAVPAFAGLSYRDLGEQGRLAAVEAGTR